MKYGLFIMPLHPPEKSLAQSYAEDVELMQICDELGFEEAWIGDHFTSRWENIPDCAMFIAHVLPQTKRIKLGTGVVCMPFHHPFALAHKIAFLDHLARGRFYFGIGSGALASDLEAFQIDYDHGQQRDMTREAVEVVFKLWSGELKKGDVFEGKYWRFKVPEYQAHLGNEMYLRPYQQPHPPIGVAGLTPNSETLRIAGERGWIPMSSNVIAYSIVKSHWETVEQAARAAGRTPDRREWRIAREIHVAPTTAQARKEVKEGAIGRAFNEYMHPNIRFMKATNLFKGDRKDIPDEAIDIDYMMDNIYLVGDPDEVARRLRELYDYVGGFGQVLMIGHDWADREVALRSMRLFAHEVMPQLRDLVPPAPAPVASR